MIYTFGESIYFNQEKKLVELQELSAELPAVSAYFGGFSRGIQIQQRLILDLYILLTTNRENLILNPLESLKRPITSYFHELLILQECFNRFHKMYMGNIKLCLMVSVFLVKKILKLLQSFGEEIDHHKLDIYFDANSYENDDIEIINQIHADFIRVLKKINIEQCLTTFVEEAIEDAKKLESY